jgi:hypothetical protein
MMGELARKVLGMKSKPKTKLEKQTKDMAYTIRNVQESSYFQRILDQLRTVAHAPVIVTTHQSMIEQVGKQNAYRELLQMFEKDLNTAERMIAEDQARQRGR